MPTVQPADKLSEDIGYLEGEGEPQQVERGSGALDWSRLDVPSRLDMVNFVIAWDGRHTINTIKARCIH